MADALIDAAVGHDYLLHSAETEYHDGDSFQKLVLRNYPVVGITSISKRVEAAWQLLATFNETSGEGDYYLDKAIAGIVIWTNAEHPGSGTRAVKVVYNWGYSSTPALISKLSAMLAAIQTYLKASGVVSSDGLVSISEGDLSLSWGSSGPYSGQIATLQSQASVILKEVVRRRLQYVPTN